MKDTAERTVQDLESIGMHINQLQGKLNFRKLSSDKDLVRKIDKLAEDTKEIVAHIKSRCEG